MRISNKLSNSISTLDIRGLGLDHRFRIEEEDNNISEENNSKDVGRNSLDKK